MKVSELIEKLHTLEATAGDVDVMVFADRGDSTFSVECVRLCTVESDDDFPEDWNMPAGFTYVELSL